MRNSFTLNGFADISILEGLTATLNGSVYSSSNRMTQTVNPFYGYGYMSYPNGYVYKYKYNYNTTNFQELLKYVHSFGKHNVSLLAGHENYKYSYDYMTGDRKNMFSYFGNQELDGATTYISNSSYKSNYNTEGWIFRGMYDYDDFTWGSASTELTIDDLCDTYNAKSMGTDYFSSDWSQQTVDRTNEVTISKNDDGTLNIYNFYGWEENFTASVDLSAKTITIKPKSDWGGYYGFAATTSSTTPVVGTISDDGTITFKDFNAWYGEYTYIDDGMTCVMTKK